MSMHLSPHDCDLLAAGLGTPELRAHAEACPDCARLLRDAEASRDAFLVTHPPAARAQALLEELGRAPRRRPRWWWALGTVTAALAILVVLVRVEAPPATRLKGERLSCQLVRGGRVLAVLGAGEHPAAEEGDALRCTVVPEARHLEVWGADGATAPQQLFAGELDGPTEIPRGSDFAVRGHGEMRLYFVWSNAALPADAFTALRALPDRPSIDGARVEWLGVVAR